MPAAPWSPKQKITQTEEEIDITVHLAFGDLAERLMVMRKGRRGFKNRLKKKNREKGGRKQVYLDAAGGAESSAQLASGGG